METLIVVAIAVVLIVVIGRLSAVSTRLSNLEERIGETNARNQERDLLTRIERLEGMVQPAATAEKRVSAAPAPVAAAPTRVPPPVVQPPAVPTAEPPPPAVAPAAIASPPLSRAPAPVIAQRHAEGATVVSRRDVPAGPPRAEPAPATAPVPISPVADYARESWIDRMRAAMQGEEWEAIVGGSWLNKLGVLVLVIGIALFLGYSIAHVGPAGRVAIGLAVSLSLVGAGVRTEKRPRYRMFARGLIGGGWAALYFTTYAMHGLSASRVIEHPFAGAVLLTAVATGMIVHSLQYRSQVVTGLAYFIGFTTLAITPVSTFSMVALVPLAGSLLYVAHRFLWTPMAVLGVVVTYGTYLVCAASAEASSLAAFYTGQSILFAYWLVFEAFDLLQVRRRREEEPDLSRAIMPLNASGFIGVSLLQWSAVDPLRVYVLLFLCAAAYTASAVLRARLRPPPTFVQETDTLTRALAGSYEGAVSVAVLLVTPAIFQRFTGLQVTGALLLEAEFLFMTGLTAGAPYLRTLASLVLAIAVLKLGFFDFALGSRLNLAALEIARSTPVAIAAASVLMLNRGLIGRRSRLLLERVYSYAASALLLAILWREVPSGYVGPTWLLAALVLFDVGVRSGFAEFRIQGYLAGFLALLIVSFDNLLGGRHRSVAAGMSILIAYAALVRERLLQPGQIEPSERLAFRRVAAWSGTTLLLALLYFEVQQTRLGLAWLLLAFPLFELGARTSIEEFRLQSYVTGLLAFGVLAFANVLDAEGYRLWLVGLAAALACGGLARERLLTADQISATERAGVRQVMSWACTVLLAAILWHELPRQHLGLAWLTLAAVLFEASVWTAIKEFRPQSYVTGLLAFGVLTFVNVLDTEGYRLWLVGLAAALACGGLARERLLTADQISATERVGVRQVMSWACTVLLAAILWHELPRQHLGLAWLTLAAVLFEASVWTATWEFRPQAYVVGALALGLLLVANGLVQLRGLPAVPWNLGMGALLTYAGFGRMFRLGSAEIGEGERDAVKNVASAAGTALIVLLVWHVLPVPLVAVGWAIVSLLLIELGFALAMPWLRAQGHLVAAVALGRLFLANFADMGATAGISHRILTVLPIIVFLYVVAARIRAARERSSVQDWEAGLPRVYLYAAVVAAVSLVRFELGREVAVVGWSLLALSLVVAGFRLDDRDLRVQSYAIALLVFVRCWVTNFYIAESLAGVSARVATGTVVIASFYAAQLLSPRPAAGVAAGRVPAGWFERLDASPRAFYSLLGTVLLAALLRYETSPPMLTVAWGVQGIVLLAAGFPLRERVLRLSGLLLLAVCTAKAFAYDFRTLDPVSRIVSFIVLGVVLLAASWTYTRFREQVQRYF